jgi:hypothetical protein
MTAWQLSRSVIFARLVRYFLLFEQDYSEFQLFLYSNESSHVSYSLLLFIAEISYVW